MANKINENEEIRNANDKAREAKQVASAEAAAVKAKAEEKLKKAKEKQKAREEKQRLKAREEGQATAEINKANRSMRSNLYRTKVANNRAKAQAELGTGATKAATVSNLRKTQAATAKNYSTAIKKMQSAAINNQKKRAKLQQMSTEYDMSTVEIISESCMVGLNEDMYFKVKIEGLPTMYVNSANREELRKDLVGLLRNPSKAVGNIKRVTPQEVKKRLRLRSQGKEEEDMNESESDGYYMMTQAKKSAASAGEDYNDRSVADRHTAKVAKKMGYTHKDYTSGTYYKSRMPGSRLIESVEINEDTILNENIYNMLIDEGYSAEEIQYIIDEGMWDDIKSKVKAGASNISKAVSNVASNIRRKVMNPDKSSLLSKARTKLNLNAKPKPTVKKPTPKPKPKLQNRRGFTPGKQAPENRLKNQRSNTTTAKPAPAFKPKPIPKNVSSGAANIIRKVQARQAARAAAKESVNEARTLPQIVSVVRDGIVRSIPSQDLENHEGMGWRHIVNPDDHKGIQAKQTKRAESMDCWDGYKKQGTKPGTGKNKGQQVNNCVPEAVSDIMSKLKNHYMNESEAYHAGLSPSTTAKRKAHFKKHGKKADDNNSAYKPAPGDARAKTKPSIHTKKADEMGMGPTDEACWDSHKQVGMKKKGKKMVPNCVPKNESYNINENKKGLQNKAEKSGMPLGVLKQVYNRGMAAWKTGHRPGTTPEQWGMARVNSFITKSSGTWGKADKDLAAKVKK